MSAKSTIRGGLPAIYGPLLPEAFDEPAVHESRATCESCQMCDHGTVPAELSASYFRPDTKCCTYHPALPNYLVGAILSDPRPELEEGKRRIREQIARRVGTGPIRLGPSKKWTMLYRAAMESSFGRSSLLRCPYLDDDQRCSVWHHRESVCATFYCKFDGGHAGSVFWKALKSYLLYAEEQLAIWAAKQVSPDLFDPRADDGAALSLAEFEERAPDPATYARYWGPWAGREEEVYLACHERVRSMTREAYAKIVDDTKIGRERLEKVVESLAALRRAPQLPDRVSLNKRLRVLPVDGGVVMTMPYNSYDSIKIEPELYDVLKAFSHADTLEGTRKKLADEQGIELEDALLSMFTTHEILVPPPKGGVCETTVPTLSSGRRCTTTKKSSEPA